MATILIQANAKINLDLKILGKRLDGFHQIEDLKIIKQFLKI